MHQYAPDSPLHGMEGLKHMPERVGARYLRSHLLPTEQIEGRHGSGPEHGGCDWRAKKVFLSGVSSGGNMAAAMRVAENLPALGRSEAVVIYLFCDSAAKYLSDAFWSEPITSGDLADCRGQTGCESI